MLCCPLHTTSFHASLLSSLCLEQGTPRVVLQWPFIAQACLLQPVFVPMLPIFSPGSPLCMCVITGVSLRPMVQPLSFLQFLDHTRLLSTLELSPLLFFGSRTFHVAPYK
jgi:hypothetical protein